MEPGVVPPPVSRILSSATSAGSDQFSQVQSVASVGSSKLLMTTSPPCDPDRPRRNAPDRCFNQIWSIHGFVWSGTECGLCRLSYYKTNYQAVWFREKMIRLHGWRQKFFGRDHA